MQSALSSAVDDRPLILTARFDPALFDALDRLRRAHFPPALNFLPAHLTLFHALPGLELEQIQLDLREVKSFPSLGLGQSVAQSLNCTLATLRFTGRGVQAAVDCEPLNLIRQSLAARWRGWLSKQDQQPFKPHVTIQNKVPSAQARQLFDQLSNTWKPLKGKIISLHLWHYAGGPWEPAAEFQVIPTE